MEGEVSAGQGQQPSGRNMIMQVTIKVSGNQSSVEKRLTTLKVYEKQKGPWFFLKK